MTTETEACIRVYTEVMRRNAHMPIREAHRLADWSVVRFIAMTGDDPIEQEGISR